MRCIADLLASESVVGCNETFGLASDSKRRVAACCTPNKTAVVDGDWCSIGSANLDWRSVLLNNELNTVILSNAFGQQMEAMFRDDTASAKGIDAATWNRRPLGEKLDEWRARLFKVLL